MGNFVCTDAAPFSLDEVSEAQSLLPNARVLQEGELLSRKTLQEYESIDHNLKAFAFYYSTETTAALTASALGPVLHSVEGSSSVTGKGSERRRASGDTAAAVAEWHSKQPRGGRSSSASGASTMHVSTAASSSPFLSFSSSTGAPTGDSLASSPVISETVSLSQSVVRLRANRAYIVLHLQRMPPAIGEHTPRNGHRQRDEDSARYGEGAAPNWASDMTELFTPRGLSVPFASDIGKPQLSLPREELGGGGGPIKHEYRFSIHLLTGRQAHPLVSAVAVVHALQLQRRLTESPELVQRLFYNCNVSRYLGPPSPMRTSACTLGRKGSDRAHTSQNGGGGGAAAAGSRLQRHTVFSENLVRPTCVGRLVMDDANGGTSLFQLAGGARATTNTAAANTVQSTRLQDVYARNSLLRVLHCVRVCGSPRTGGSYPATGSGPNSARFSKTSSPRSSTTPRSARMYPFQAFTRNAAAPAASTAASSSPLGVATSSSATQQQQQQGPPVFEVVPRLKFSAIDTRRGGALSGRVPPQQQGPFSPEAGSPPSKRPHTDYLAHDNKEGRLQAASPHMTATDSYGIPRLPIIANLPTSTAASAAAAAAAAGNASRQLPQQSGSGSAEPLYSFSGGGETNEPYDETDERQVSDDRVRRLRLAASEATEILPYLFVGGMGPAEDRAQLLEKGITAIVNTVSVSVPNYYPDIFSYMPLNLHDSPDEPIFSLFPLVNAFIEKVQAEGGRVYIHCHQGVSRSCSFIIAYLMWKKGLCYDRAYDVVRARRNVCSPNAGFYVNLIQWQGQLSSPVFNRAYAFVPYTKDSLMPFSYRAAVAFRDPSRRSPTSSGSNQAQHGKYAAESSSGGGGGFYGDERTITLFKMMEVEMDVKRQSSYTLDERLCYAFIFGEVEGGRAVNGSLKSFLVKGPKTTKEMFDAALKAWPEYVHYNFYHGEMKQSFSHKHAGRVTTFTYWPLPLLSYETTEDKKGRSAGVVPVVTSVEELQREIIAGMTLAHAHHRKGSGASGGGSDNDGGVALPSMPQLKHTREKRWDALLSSPDLLSQLRSYIQLEAEAESTASMRRQKREEVLALLSGAASSRSATTTTVTTPRSGGSRPESSRVGRRVQPQSHISPTPPSQSPRSVGGRSLTGLHASHSTAAAAGAPAPLPMNSSTTAPLLPVEPSDSNGNHGGFPRDQYVRNHHVQPNYNSGSGQSYDSPLTDPETVSAAVDGRARTGHHHGSPHGATASTSSKGESPRGGFALPQGFAIRMNPNVFANLAAANAGAGSAASDVGMAAERAPTPLADFLVFEYPFDESPLDDIVYLTDLEPGKCFAVVLPRPEEDGNHVFLWIGSQCTLTETQVLEAYQSSLVSSSSSRSAGQSGKAHTVRLPSGALLPRTVSSVVRDGEEPDELLLVLDA